MFSSAKVGVFEFAGDEVRLAIVKAGGRVPKVLEHHSAAAEYASPEGRAEALVAAVKNVVDRAKASPAAYVLCVSSAHSVVRSLPIPFRGKRKVAAAVQFELERYLAIPIEDLSVDFVTVGESRSQTDVLAVGLRRDTIEEQLALLNAAGVDPEGVELDAIGLTGLWKAVQPGPKGLHAVLHVRDAGTSLAIVHTKTLVYLRYLAFTPQEVIESPSAVAREVGNSLRAFNGTWNKEGEVASLTVSGLRLSEEQRDVFEKELEIPVSNRDLGAKVLPGHAETAARDGEANRWEALAGVALGAASGSGWVRQGFALNFRRGDLASKNVLAGLLPQVMVSASLALLLLLGVAWFFHHGYRKNVVEAAELDAQIQEIEAEVAQLQSQGLGMDTEVFSTPTLLDILREIGTKLPDSKATVTEIRVDPVAEGSEKAWLTVRGEVKGEASDALFAEIKASAVLDVSAEPDLRLADGKSTFTITVRRRLAEAAQ